MGGTFGSSQKYKIDDQHSVDKAFLFLGDPMHKTGKEVTALPVYEVIENYKPVNAIAIKRYTKFSCRY